MAPLPVLEAFERENLACQAAAAARSQFSAEIAESLAAGDGRFYSSDPPLNPKRELFSPLIDAIKADNPESQIKIFLIDQNYQSSFLSEGLRTGVARVKPSYVKIGSGPEGFTYFAKRWTLCTSVKKSGAKRAFVIYEGLLVLFDETGRDFKILRLFMRKA